jgi:hypothetical protein
MSTYSHNNGTQAELHDDSNEDKRHVKLYGPRGEHEFSNPDKLETHLRD